MTLAALRQAPLEPEGGFSSVEVRSTQAEASWRRLALELAVAGFIEQESGPGQVAVYTRGTLTGQLGSEHVARYSGGVLIYSRTVRSSSPPACAEAA